jgi:hypothetical protein
MTAKHDMKKDETIFTNKSEQEIYLNICNEKSISNFKQSFLENSHESDEEHNDVSKYSELLDINYTDKSDILNDIKKSNNSPSTYYSKDDDNEILISNKNIQKIFNKNNFLNKDSSNQLSVNNNIPNNDFFQSELYYNILNKEKVNQTIKTK